MSQIFFTHDEILERPNSRYPADDPFQIHYHFRPARPANLTITKDKDTGNINVSAGTIGPLTWVPYTMCLHVNIHGSPHTYNNLQIGSHCVVSLPGRDIVDETWYTALPLLEGISEMEVAGLHTVPSTLIDVPGVAECPVNFECVVEFKHDYYTHGIFFLRILGASIDEKVLTMSREEVVSWFPTYEVDDMANEWGGSIERLGVMGDIFPCPTFPIGAKEGWYTGFNAWIVDLASENYITKDECDKTLKMVDRYKELLKSDFTSDEYKKLHTFFTQLPKDIIKRDWKALSTLIQGA
jgi:flavin reductase (DIM6/NTAB) family NADH-FMN oxidoreductase RutF